MELKPHFTANSTHNQERITSHYQCSVEYNSSGLYSEYISKTVRDPEDDIV